jgi:hypothetical protein
MNILNRFLFLFFLSFFIFKSTECGFFSKIIICVAVVFLIRGQISDLNKLNDGYKSGLDAFERLINNS